MSQHTGGKVPHLLSDPDWWFWSKVDKRGPDDCWPWTGRINKHGYGEVVAEGHRWRTHQLAYYFGHGKPPQKMVCHTCEDRPDNKRCCNPAHLYDGTPLSNAQDRKATGGYPSLPGHLNPTSKLTPEAVTDIRTSKEPARVLAARYGVSRRSVYLARGRKTYRNVR